MSLKSILMGGFAVLALSACNSATSSSDAEMMKSDEGVNISQTSDKLDQVLAAQSDKNKERFDARNPKETLMFFGVEPGMTVVEALPGGGWYTKILLPYLGEEGKVIGVDYALEMWPEFGTQKIFRHLRTKSGVCHRHLEHPVIIQSFAKSWQELARVTA